MDFDSSFANERSQRHPRGAESIRQSGSDQPRLQHSGRHRLSDHRPAAAAESGFHGNGVSHIEDAALPTAVQNSAGLVFVRFCQQPIGR